LKRKQGFKAARRACVCVRACMLEQASGAAQCSAAIDVLC